MPERNNIPTVIYKTIPLKQHSRNKYLIPVMGNYKTASRINILIFN